MKLYLSGPMSNVAHFNIPAFDSAAAALRGMGYDIVSPAELDDPETRRKSLESPDGAPDKVGRTWGECLARDVKVVADEVQGVIFLPDWHTSRGARLEAFVALLCGHQFYAYSPGAGPMQLSDRFVRERLL